MGLHVPSGQDWRFQLTNATGRPAAAMGTSVTAADGAYGSYVEIIDGANVTTDCYAIMICVNSFSSSATYDSGILTIGKDETGGTSYSDWLTDLVITNATPYNQPGSGVWYYFPMYIKAGTSLAAKAWRGGGVLSPTVAVWLFGSPVAPETVRYATQFRSFGVNTGNASLVTNVTIGTTSEGAWTQLGSATDIPLWWWQYGYSDNDTTSVASVMHIDIGAGDASNKKILIMDAPFTTQTNERFTNPPLTAGCTGNVATGALIYGRGQCSGTPNSGSGLVAYGVG